MADNCIVTAPSVRLIGKPQVLTENIVDWLLENQLIQPDYAEHPAQPINAILANAPNMPASVLAEIGGRLCYNSYEAGRPGAAWAENIIDEKHGSVFAHGMYTFAIAGVARSLTHEQIRHNIGVGISQESQRYVREDGNARFVAPPLHLQRWSNDTDSREAQCWLQAQREGLSQYKLDLAENTEYLQANWPMLSARDVRKRAAEAARSSLPNAIETRLIWSCSLRAARHIVNMRYSLGADAEIRRLFAIISKTLVQAEPHAFCDFNVHYDEPSDSFYTTSRNGGI